MVMPAPEVGVEVGLGTRLEELVAALGQLVSAVEPGCVAGQDAAALAGVFARGERLCAAGKAVMARRAAECDTWAKAGARSAEDWLAAISGSALGDARAELDTARRMSAQPDVEAAFRSGRLSAAQAEKISAAAQGAPAAAASLVEKADGSSLKGLADACKALTWAARSGEDDAGRYRRIHAGRYLRSWTDDEGAGRIALRLAPDAHAQVLACLRPFQDRVFDSARRGDTRERSECYAADALVDMAATAAARAGHARPTAAAAAAGHASGPAGARPTAAAAGAGHQSERSGGPPGSVPRAEDRSDQAPSGGAPPGAPSPGAPSPGAPSPGAPSPGEPVPEPVGPPATVVAVIDHRALVRGYAEAGERCEIDGVGPVPVAAVRAMAADAFLAAVITDGVDVRRVVHLGRQPTAAQRSALLVRDRTCVVPGCDVSRGLEIDHVDGWAGTHITTVDRLARLCHHHHHLKTYQGWTLTGRPGAWEWNRPPPGPFDDESLAAQPPLRSPAPDPYRAPPAPPPAQLPPPAPPLRLSPERTM